MAEARPVRGRVFDIQRFSIHDGPGIRTVVFCQSCPLECRWCSNPESQASQPVLLHNAARCIRCRSCVHACSVGAITYTDSGIQLDRSRCVVCGECCRVCPTGALRIAGQEMTVEQVLQVVARDRPFYRHSGGGLTLSGGEPLAQPEFCYALLRAARTIGLQTAVETCGCAEAGVAEAVLQQTDLVLYDVKHLDARKHRAGTGASNERILENARRIAGLGVPMVIRVPVVPGFNDTVADVRAIGEFALALGLSEVHLLPYHRYGVPKYASLGREYDFARIAPPSEEHIGRLQLELEGLRLQVRIGG